MTSQNFSIAKDFSPYPGPRFARQGPHSGELLSRRLAKILRENEGLIEIDLDGTVGYGSSFLDEAFGSLIREHGFTGDELLQRITFISRLDPSFIKEIKDAIYFADLRH